MPICDGACLRAELGGGGEDNDAWGVAHGEAVADALLLLTHALYQWQQVCQCLPTPCRNALAIHDQVREENTGRAGSGYLVAGAS